MHKKVKMIGLYAALAAASAAAQTNTFPTSGNVGIGTTSPAASLDIQTGHSVLRIGPQMGGDSGSQVEFKRSDGWNPASIVQSYDTGNYGGDLSFRVHPPDGNPATVPITALYMKAGGNVGIGTTTPEAPLVVASGSVSGNYQVFNALTVRPAGGSAYGENGSSIYLGSMTNHGLATVAGIWSALGNGGDGGVNYDGALVMGTTIQGSALPSERARIDRFGNFGIGTNAPGAKLEVNGNVKLTNGSGASFTFADGTIQSTAWTGTLCGGDYAESVDVSGERAQYEPGDVLVIDPSHPGNFLKSSHPYSRLVAGIYSTKPGLVGRRQSTDPKLNTTEVPMAMVGIVPTKVTAENGPIEVGDLLVSSSLPAHAMKGSDGALPTGTVIGKALGSLASGTGVIEVLVSLQ